MIARTRLFPFTQRWGGRTCLKRRDPYNVIGKSKVFSKAIPNVVNGPIILDVGMSCCPIDGHVFTEIHLRNKMEQSGAFLAGEGKLPAP